MFKNDNSGNAIPFVNKMELVQEEEDLVENANRKLESVLDISDRPCIIGNRKTILHNSNEFKR